MKALVLIKNFLKSLPSQIDSPHAWRFALRNSHESGESEDGEWLTLVDSCEHSIWLLWEFAKTHHLLSRNSFPSECCPKLLFHSPLKCCVLLLASYWFRDKHTSQAGRLSLASIRKALLNASNCRHRASGVGANWVSLFEKGSRARSGPSYLVEADPLRILLISIARGRNMQVRGSDLRRELRLTLADPVANEHSLNCCPPRPTAQLLVHRPWLCLPTLFSSSWRPAQPRACIVWKRNPFSMIKRFVK